MKATFVDLRKKSRQIIEALGRNERITLLYRGRPAAIMHPINGAVEPPMASAVDHPAFGLWRDREDHDDVAAHVRELRRGRVCDR